MLKLREVAAMLGLSCVSNMSIASEILISMSAYDSGIVEWFYHTLSGKMSESLKNARWGDNARWGADRSKSSIGRCFTKQPLGTVTGNDNEKDFAISKDSNVGLDR